MEPKHMRELHKIREKLAQKWKGLNPEEKLRFIKESANRMEEDIKLLRQKRKKTAVL